MEFSADTPTRKRKISEIEITLPQPYKAGAYTLSEGEASALNQTIAENVSNNLRKKFDDGIETGEKDGEGKPVFRDYTPEEAQAAVDAYLKDYEIGVRRSGSGEPRVTDPVEREARKIARQKAIEFVRSQGGKPSDYDMPPITEAIFEANKDLLMAEGKKIVRALEAAKDKSGGINLEGVALVPAKAKGSTADDSEEAEAEAAE